MAAAGGKTGLGLGFYVSDHNPKTFVNIGAFISAIIYFVIFMAVIYFLIVQPYKLTPATNLGCCGAFAFQESAHSRASRAAATFSSRTMRSKP